MSKPRSLEEVKEYFSLSMTGKAAKILGQPSREHIRQQLEVGRQQAKAAKILWFNGHSAEGLRLASSAFDETVSAVPAFGESHTPVEATAPSGEDVDVTDTLRRWGQRLQGQGLSERKLDKLHELNEKVISGAWPVLDGNTHGGHHHIFKHLLDIRGAVDGVLLLLTATPREMTVRRIKRTAIMAASAVVCMALGYFIFTTAPAAAASGQYSPWFAAHKVIDGNYGTEWLLPDRKKGWIELQLPAQRVETVRVLNAHNRWLNDRATKAYTIEIHTSDGSRKEIKGEWKLFFAKPAFTNHAVGMDGVVRIRVNINSWHKKGAGIAEIEWK